MADKNKLFLGTNQDTYVAADDAGNIVLQTEHGSRAVLDTEGLKVGLAGAEPTTLSAGDGGGSTAEAPAIDLTIDPTLRVNQGVFDTYNFEPFNECLIDANGMILLNDSSALTFLSENFLISGANNKVLQEMVGLPVTPGLEGFEYQGDYAVDPENALKPFDMRKIIRDTVEKHYPGAYANTPDLPVLNQDYWNNQGEYYANVWPVEMGDIWTYYDTQLIGDLTVEFTVPGLNSFFRRFADSGENWYFHELTNEVTLEGNPFDPDMPPSANMSLGYFNDLVLYKFKQPVVFGENTPDPQWSRRDIAYFGGGATGMFKLWPHGAAEIDENLLQELKNGSATITGAGFGFEFNHKYVASNPSPTLLFNRFVDANLYPIIGGITVDDGGLMKVQVPTDFMSFLAPVLPPEVWSGDPETPQNFKYGMNIKVDNLRFTKPLNL